MTIYEGGDLNSTFGETRMKKFCLAALRSGIGYFAPWMYIWLSFFYILQGNTINLSLFINHGISSLVAGILFGIGFGFIEKWLFKKK